MKHLGLWVAVALALAAPGLAYADGEPTAEFSDSGVIVPVDARQAEVVEQRVTVTLPSPRRVWERPATIRAEYVLRNRGRVALRMMIGWPVSRTGYNGDVHRVGLPAVKLDGGLVPATFLSLDDLAEDYAKEWLPRIDKLLAARPALRAEVLAARQPEGGRGSARADEPRLSTLARWLDEHEPSAKSVDTVIVAAGLMGVADSGLRCDQTVQEALKWLDPSYQQVRIYPLLAKRWDQETRLLDPLTGRLEDTRPGMLDNEPDFGIFRFPVTLQPGREHRLVLQYGQFLGFESESSCHGLAYVMKPARRWGRWQRTTIEVLVPPQWRNVGIRPAAEKVGTRAGRALYRIRMGRPSGNLYVSVDEERRDIALWSRRADAVVSQWLDKKQDKAAKEFLRYGRGPATAAMRRLINGFPADDGRRFTAGFVLYVLDLDRALGRSVMVKACASGKYPGVEYPSALLSAAYQHHPEARLIAAGLNLTRQIREGAMFEMGELFRQLAEDNPRDLLTALKGKPGPTWEDTALVLYRRGKRGELVRYRGLERVAKDERNHQHPEAQRLTAAMQAMYHRERAAEEKERQRRAQLPVHLPEGVDIPIGAARALQIERLNSSILHTRSFDGRVIAFVRERFGDAAGPQYCRGDFDGDGSGDVAVLTVQPDLGFVNLVVLRQTAEDQWTTEELADLPNPPRARDGSSRLLVFITPRAPGSVAYRTEKGKAGRLDLQHDGVELNTWGKTGVLYSWTGSRWTKVQTAD